jgi:hypothetical protein
MVSQDLIIQLLTQRFDALDKRLDVMDAKNDQRDLRVNTMDASNKKEVAELKEEIAAAKTAWRVVMGITTSAAVFIGYIVSQIPAFWAMLHKS